MGKKKGKDKKGSGKGKQTEVFHLTFLQCPQKRIEEGGTGLETENNRSNATGAQVWER